jgi:hypothetical protein
VRRFGASLWSTDARTTTWRSASTPRTATTLSNDLEPYALAYFIATLLNNLDGRGKEPFWQQAYTDLVRFLILLRRVVDGYTTLAEIYHYAIDESVQDAEAP